MLLNKLFHVALHRAHPRDRYNAWASPLLPDSQRFTPNHEAAMLCCDCSLLHSHILQRLTFIPYTASAPITPLTNTTTAAIKHCTDSQLGHSDFMICWVVTVFLRLAEEYNSLGLLGNPRTGKISVGIILKSFIRCRDEW